MYIDAPTPVLFSTKPQPKLFEVCRGPHLNKQSGRDEALSNTRPPGQNVTHSRGITRDPQQGIAMLHSPLVTTTGHAAHLRAQSNTPQPNL